MDIAIKIVGVILGILAGVWTFHALNGALFAVLAFLGAVAVGVIVYYVVVRLLSEVLGNTPPRV